MRALVVGIHDVKIYIHVGDIERYVLCSLGGDAVGKFGFGHGLDGNLLHNDRMAAHRSCHRLGFDAVLPENLADGTGNTARVYDHGVDHNVAGQRFHTQMRNLDLALGTFEFNRLDATGPYV